ncbi:Sperm-associated antigen 16 protein, partial [Lamprotornis superbus]
MAVHPQKKIVLSGGDDRLWKTWGFPDGNILQTGEGHTDWLSGCCFRPSCLYPLSSGTQLVTSSGDTTVRIWDLSRRGCILTLRGHSRAVRGCSWHSCGDFVASASTDGTSKIWDVNSFPKASFPKLCVVGREAPVGLQEALLELGSDVTQDYFLSQLLAEGNPALFQLCLGRTGVVHHLKMVRRWQIRVVGGIPGNSALPILCSVTELNKHSAPVAPVGGTRLFILHSSRCFERCRYTLRGHEDSVNSIEFLPFSSTVLTSSADKTLSLWDVR